MISHDVNKSMGVRPTQLTENRKNRLAKLFRILDDLKKAESIYALSMTASGAF